MFSDSKKKHFGLIAIVIWVASALMVALVSVPTTAGATTVVASPLTAVKTVENATISAHQKAGYVVSGSPTNR